MLCLPGLSGIRGWNSHSFYHSSPSGWDVRGDSYSRFWFCNRVVVYFYVLPVQHHPVQVQRVQPLLEAEGSQHLQCFACLQVTAKIEVRFIPRSGVIRYHGVWNKWSINNSGVGKYDMEVNLSEALTLSRVEWTQTLKCLGRYRREADCSLWKHKS